MSAKSVYPGTFYGLKKNITLQKNTFKETLQNIHIMNFITIFLYLAFLFVSFQTNSQSMDHSIFFQKQKIEKLEKSPIIALITKSFIADTVSINTPLTFNVFYKNIGKEPLIISKVRTSCSCTVASYSKTPLQPGNTDKIVLKLDTGKPGTFIKAVAIYSNASNQYDKSINSSRVTFKIKWTVKDTDKTKPTKNSINKSK